MSRGLDPHDARARPRARWTPAAPRLRRARRTPGRGMRRQAREGEKRRWKSRQGREAAPPLTRHPPLRSGFACRDFLRRSWSPWRSRGRRAGRPAVPTACSSATISPPYGCSTRARALTCAISTRLTRIRGAQAVKLGPGRPPVRDQRNVAADPKVPQRHARIRRRVRDDRRASTRRASPSHPTATSTWPVSATDQVRRLSPAGVALGHPGAGAVPRASTAPTTASPSDPTATSTCPATTRATSSPRPAHRRDHAPAVPRATRRACSTRAASSPTQRRRHVTSRARGRANCCASTSRRAGHRARERC